MNKDNLHEALQIDYRLRSTFFYRKLHELGFITFDTEVDKLVDIGDNFNWKDRAQWGVSSKAWNTITQTGIPELAVFAHPRVLQEQPKLSAYYRNIAVLSQKAVSKLAFGIANVERGKSGLSPERALSLCQLYNAHASLIIESAANYSQKDITALLFASAGAQINGSWLNQIGIEAELVVRKILVRFALQNSLIVSAIFKDGITSEDLGNLIDRVKDLSGIRLKNQTSVLFASEPDISLLNESGALIAVIEVKGGKDTAGALERYGAAKKSFEDALRDNPQARTVFLASCITDEVQTRLDEDKTVHHVYNLTILITSEEKRDAFAESLFRLLGTNH